MLNISKLKKEYAGKKVFITGHTGFKGSYMCLLLKYLGAKVYGYSLKEEKNSLYDILKKEHKGKFTTKDIYADVRDYKKLHDAIKTIKPDYILHMAAQPLVLRGYKEPRYTYEVNVIGTLNLMDAIRDVYGDKKRKMPVSILNVTTDKVYENNDLSNYAFTESDKLCGQDPYANSKSCSELVTFSYLKSFFQDKKIYRVSTARAGNVVGGGDMSENRIIPDCVRAIRDKKEMIIRNPHSVRPYQYVIEPLILYLNIMAYQIKSEKYEGNYNIGPDKRNCLKTGDLVTRFYDAYADILIDKKESGHIANVKILDKNDKNKKHEAAFLRLDNSKIKKVFDYKEIFDMSLCMKYTAEIYYLILHKKPISEKIISFIK